MTKDWEIFFNLFFNIFSVLLYVPDTKAQAIFILNSYPSSTSGSWKVQIHLLSLIITEGDFLFGINDST